VHELQEKLAIASKQLALHEEKAKGSGGHSRHGGRRVARGSAGLGPSALSSALAAAEQAALQQQAEAVAAAVAAASEDEAAIWMGRCGAGTLPNLDAPPTEWE
jgi:hypothetical protein